MPDEPSAEVVPLLRQRPDAQQTTPPPAEQPRKKTSKQGKLEAAQRRHKIIQATLAGFDADQIAAQLGTTRAVVTRTVNEQLERWQDEDRRGVTELREMQLRRLETLVRTLWPQATGQTVEGVKQAPNLKAIAEIRNLTSTQARLAGTEAPKKLEVGGDVGITISMEELADLDDAWAASGGDVLEGRLAE